MKKQVLLILSILIIIALCLVIYFFPKSNSFFDSVKDDVITAENYEEIMKKIGVNAEKDDELYYFTYCCIYHITKDGISAAFSNNENDDAMYVNIYGKTVGQLVDEGKELMKENNITLEQYKENLKNSNN